MEVQCALDAAEQEVSEYRASSEHMESLVNSESSAFHRELRTAARDTLIQREGSS